MTDTEGESPPQAPPRLQVLLAGPRITDAGLKHLEKCPQLADLSLHESSITGAGLKRCLDRLPQIRRLDLSRCTIDFSDCGADFDIGEKNRQLQYLDLSGMRLKNTPWELLIRFPRLRSLSLANTNITDEDLHALKTCKGLDMLDLSGTAVTDTGIGYLKVHPGIRSLVLRDTANGVRRLYFPVPR